MPRTHPPAQGLIHTWPFTPPAQGLLHTCPFTPAAQGLIRRTGAFVESTARSARLFSAGVGVAGALSSAAHDAKKKAHAAKAAGEKEKARLGNRTAGAAGAAGVAGAAGAAGAAADGMDNAPDAAEVGDDDGDDSDEEALFERFMQEGMAVYKMKMLRLMWRILKADVETVLLSATHKLLYDKSAPPRLPTCLPAYLTIYLTTILPYYHTTLLPY